MRQKRVSLTQHLIEENRRYGTVPEELRLLLEVVARACKTIGHSVGKGALGNILGSNETENVQGEVQKKLDILSNEILLESNEWGGHLSAMASEEMETIHPISKTYPTAVTCFCSTAGRIEQYRRERVHRHHLFRAENAGRQDRCR